MLDKQIYKVFLSKIFTLPIKVNFWDGSTESFGKHPEITVTLHDKMTVDEIKENPSLVIGEAYMDKKIEVEGPEDAIQQVINNVYETMGKIKEDEFLKSFWPKKDKNKPSHSKVQSKEDVQSHYDIGNDFYNLWLDETMTYSGAYFETEETSLYDAQVHKVHHILSKLSIQPGDTLLDIGCGWGTLIIAAAKKYQAKATGITLSQEQFDYVQQRIKEEGLEDSVTIILEDYRELKNVTYNCITSIGMVEHVGPENLHTYFDTIKHLLAPNGIALIQGITRQQGGATNSWINKYIFPGGYVPGFTEILTHEIENHLQIIDLEFLRRHYQKTLEHWTQNFHRQLPTIEKTHDERFIRMWDVYLQACAASFQSGNIDLVQYLLTNGVRNDLPLTRDYMN